MKKSIIMAAAALSLSFGMQAQTEAPADSAVFDHGVVYVEPLFEYPSAPENIETFRDKCNWLVENFWKPLNVNPKETVDQAKLSDAVKVYITACQYADKAKTVASVEKLYKSIQKNPSLLFQMTKAAEETIFGPRAEVWIDELYVEILRNALSQKKFPAQRRARYEAQLKQLENSLLGGKPASFGFVRPDGSPATYFPMSTPTLIFFGSPDCDDCRMAKLRLQSNVAFNKAINEGKINVLYIIPDADEGWEKKVSDYPSKWAVGASDTVSEVMDIRDIPDIYVIDGEGKIVSKHSSLTESMQTILSLVQ
ncbi:MAG: DUF5106 domain-containing protein, partial [Muribaculaceae bacterium]|nr:DUF5106 domain-containing protein [Muribaculaceae bacterium]